MRHLHFVARLASMMSLLVLCVVAVPTHAEEGHSNMQDKIIISGASGQLGELAIKKLLARGVPAKNLILVSRTPEKLNEYVKLGAESRFGDFNKPESLKAAFAGGTKLLLISIGFGPIPRPQAHKNAIDAAVAAGVKQIAYTSWVGLSKNDYTGLGVDHHQTEELLRKSGVAWTFLRNSIYMDNLLSQGAKMVADGAAVVPAQEIRIANITREDCAEAAAAVLTTPGHDNKTYDIAGTELLGVREIAAAASAVTGKKVEVTESKSPAPAGFVGVSASVVSQDFAKLTGHAPTSLKSYFQANKSPLMGGK
jgi:NAD(P)H dehydrogenase (quinone)